MTDEPERAYLPDAALARQTAARARMSEIMDLPEAKGRENLAFALAIRMDIPTGRARTLLAEAPDINRVEDIQAWASRASAQPELKVVR